MIQLRFAQDTAYDPAAWTEELPMTGHCAIAALCVQDAFGGAIHRVITPYGYTHYFNVLNDGALVDLTAGQFSQLDYRRSGEVSRAYILSKEDTRRRYELLKERSAAPEVSR